MAILITGGAGYIGGHTVLAMLEAGYEVVALDNFYNAKPGAVSRVQELAGQAFPFYEGDVRDLDVLRRIFRAHPIEAVIHFAGLKAVGESVKKPLEYYDCNVGGTVTLCRAMNEAGCKRLVFSSSATVYDGDCPSPRREDMPTGKVSNPYGRTKYVVEEILKDLCASDESWSAVLLRYFHLEETALEIPLDLHGTTFQRSVWELLTRIPYGNAVSYSEIAEQLGRPSAVRAVAQAIGNNPCLIFVPCHRVLGKDGSLTGFSGGIALKRQLLDLERIPYRQKV